MKLLRRKDHAITAQRPSDYGAMTALLRRKDDAITAQRHMLLVVAVSLLFLASCTRRPADIATLTMPGGEVYRGQLAAGKPHGMGVLYRGDTIVYSGQWSRGMRQGRGVAADPTGAAVTGTWDHDTIVTASRRDSAGVYTGEMDSLMRANGYGHYRDTLGTYYEGRWRHGRRTGFGFSSQHRYFRVGEWRDDVYKGERLRYTSDRVYGIDISKYQHIQRKKRYSIQWDRLRITHLGSLSKKNVSGKVDFKISFIFIKATEGKTVVNPYYAADYAAARAHGYPVGSYHYFTHLTSGADQARHFLSRSSIRKGDLPPVLDLEPLPSQVKAMGGAAGMWRRVRAWLQAVERQTGMRPILYVSQTFVNRWLDAAPDVKRGYPVWIARYGEYKPDVKLWIWQLAPDGRVSGIVGHTDINVFNGYQGEFNRWKAAVSKR